MHSLWLALGGALLIALVSTAGDFVWANWHVRHLAFYGVLHGVVIFLATGWYLGRLAGRPVAGAVAGVIAGATGAGSFYALAPLMGYSAMFVSWILVWTALGVITPMLRDGRPKEVASIGLVVRGVVAALASGAAFYVVSGMWFPFNPATPADYIEHFGRWTFAFLPGFAALLCGPGKNQRSHEDMKN
jgi:hypothetical protein